MSKSEQVAFDEILAFVGPIDAQYENWYAGIAANAMDRLFGDHRVPQGSDHVHAVPTKNSDVARRVEKRLLALGFDGGGGGGDDSTTWVYTYKKTGVTVP